MDYLQVTIYGYFSKKSSNFNQNTVIAKDYGVDYKQLPGRIEEFRHE
jgi:hypothetical protein